MYVLIDIAFPKVTIIMEINEIFYKNKIFNWKITLYYGKLFKIYLIKNLNANMIVIFSFVEIISQKW